MDKPVNILKTVYDKGQADKVLDRNFKTFTNVTTQENLPTVEDFFDLYENLYYEIPIQGEINSHEYLIKRSSELISTETTPEEIQPLLDEIAQLREQLLQANEQIFNLQTSSL